MTAITTRAAMDGPNKRYIDPPSQGSKAVTKNRPAQTANEGTLIDYSRFAVALWLVANDRPILRTTGQPFVFVHFLGNLKS
jgi:hypothetical protein